MATQRIVIPYSPRKQFVPFHMRTQRWAIIVAHRRAGKTVACVNELIRGALTCTNKRPMFGYIAPLLKQAKSVAWEYLKEFALVVPGAEANETELRVDFPNGGRVRLFGADNPDSLRGLYFDGVTLDEAADMPASLYGKVIRPALSDRKGWCVWIGSTKGYNEFHDQWERSANQADWFRLMLKASETRLIEPAELDDARKQMSPAEYEQEYECSFEAAITGSFYGEEIRRLSTEGRLMPLPIERSLPVHTSWDLGFTDSTAIWFIQISGREIRLVDYYEASGVALDHYVTYLNDWRAKHGTTWGSHYLPHDVQQHELSTGKSRLQTLFGLGLTATVVDMHHVMDGINAVRRMFERTVIDPERCQRGLEALRNYRRDWDDKNRVFRPKPLHDWTTHGSDSLRYFAAGFFEPTIAIKERRERYRGSTRDDTSWQAA